MQNGHQEFIPRDYIYYIETDGSAEMNKMLFDALEQSSYENDARELHVKGGKVAACECPNYLFLSRFKEAAKSLAGKYRVWVKEGKAMTARHFCGNFSPAVCSSGRVNRSKSSKRKTFDSLVDKLDSRRKMKINVSVKVS
jgi:hypothetical protein